MLNDDSQNRTKTCPFCAEAVKPEAKVCPFCRCWQKKWTLSNPQTAGLVFGLIGILTFGLMTAFFERMLGPKNEFAVYRDQITIVNSQVSRRAVTSSGESNSNVIISVAGTLTNQSDVAWKAVSVEARFFDQSGIQFDAIPANADSYREVVVLPHGEAAFKIETKAAQPAADYTNYKLAVRWAKDVDQIL